MSPKQLERRKASWKAYQEWYDEWEQKGYAMGEKKTREQYEEAYDDAVSLGMKNVARTLASQDRLVKREEALRISTAVKKALEYETTETGEKVRKGFMVKKIIKEGEPGYVPGMKNYKFERIDLSKYNIDFSKLTTKAIRSQSIGDTYDYLRKEAGLSAREAGSIIDEMYLEDKK